MTRQMEKYFTTYYDQERQIYVSIAGDLREGCMAVCNVVFLLAAVLMSIFVCLKLPLCSWFVVMFCGMLMLTLGAPVSM